MNEDLAQLGGWVDEGDWPAITCPTCAVGQLSTPKSAITLIPIADPENGRSFPENGYFHGTFTCRRNKCKEIVAATGRYEMESVFDAKSERLGYKATYHLQLVLPPLLIILALPNATPQIVCTRIKEAALILWADPNAASSRLRLAIEGLLTHEGMRRYKIVRHKRVRLTTHERLKELEHYVGFPATAFEAVKWIGNQGTHENDLTVKDVLEASEILGYGLELLYGNRDDLFERKVRKVIKAKGIRKRSGASK
jgi:hypothetical protein